MDQNELEDTGGKGAGEGDELKTTSGWPGGGYSNDQVELLLSRLAQGYTRTGTLTEVTGQNSGVHPHTSQP